MRILFRRFVKILIFVYLAVFNFSLAHANLPPRPISPQFKQLYIGSKGVLLAVLHDGAVRSTDDGQHWKRVLQDTVGNLTLYVTKEGLILINPYQHRYISRDEGITWKEDGQSEIVEWSAFLSRRDFSDVFSLDSTGKVYACYSGQLKFSEDFGKTWASAPPFPEFEGRLQNCGKIAIINQTVFVLVKGGILQSENGKNWSYVEQNTSNLKLSFAGEPNVDSFKADNFGNLYAETDLGLFKSNNKGASWHRNFFGITEKSQISIYFVRHDAVYFSIFRGHKSQDPRISIYRTEDGETSEKFDFYYPWNDIQSNKSGAIYIVTDMLIYKSSNKGKTWTALSRDGID